MDFYSTSTAWRHWRAAAPCCWWKSGSTCSPVFTLLRDDVTRSPTPHVALPGNMKGENRKTCCGQASKVAHTQDLKTGQIIAVQRHGGNRQRYFICLKWPTYCVFGKVFLWIISFSGNTKVSKPANFVRWSDIWSDLREHMLLFSVKFVQ